MMPERAARVTLGGTEVRALAHVVVAAALLLQLLMMPPLAMRMLSGVTSSNWPATLCASSSSARTSVPLPYSPLPASSHDQDGCPLCQSHSVPLAPLVAGMVIVVLITRWRWLHGTTVVILAPSTPFRLYSSRAPPAAA